MSLWSKYVGGKADQANASLTQFVAAQDPNGMGEAALQQLASQLREAQSVLGRRQVALQSATDAVEADKAAVRKLMGTAEILAKNGSEAKANEMMDKVEEANTRLEADKGHLEGARKSADLAQQSVSTLEGKLRQGRQSLETRKRDMSDARTERDQAKDQEALASKEAGLSKSANDFDAVLKAMDTQTSKLKGEADTARRMAGSLSNVVGDTEKDPEVIAAMAEAEGKSQPRQSVAERLAAARAAMADAA